MGIVELVEEDILHHYDNAAGCRFFGVRPGETAGERSPPSARRRTSCKSGSTNTAIVPPRAAVRFEYQYEPPSGPLAHGDCQSYRGQCPRPGTLLLRRRGHHVASRGGGCHSEKASCASVAWPTVCRPSSGFPISTASAPTSTRPGWNSRGSIEQELGDGWIDNLHPDDRDPYLNAYANAFAEHKSFELEYRLRHKDGVYRWVLARGTPRFNPSGGFAGFVGLCLDVTDRAPPKRPSGGASATSPTSSTTPTSGCTGSVPMG